MPSAAPFSPALLDAIDRDDATAMDSLLAAGADALATDGGGNTLLTLAAAKASARVVETLAPRSRARVRDRMGRPALMNAIVRAPRVVEEGRSEALRATLRTLAPLSQFSSWNKRGESAMSLAAASPCAALIFDEIAPFCEPKDWARTDCRNENALGWAIAAGNEQAARWLLNRGIFDVNATQPGVWARGRLRESRFAKGYLAEFARMLRSNPWLSSNQTTESLWELLAEQTDFSIGSPPNSINALELVFSWFGQGPDPRQWRLADAVAARALDRKETQTLLAQGGEARRRFPRAFAAMEAKALQESIAREKTPRAAQSEESASNCASHGARELSPDAKTPARRL